MALDLTGAAFECAYNGPLLAGVDEVGRGPLAGPVVTAAVILDPERPIDGLMDSKKLTEKRRERLFDLIVDQALSWSLGRCEVDEIDALNIYQATMLAMERAVNGLHREPEYVLVDGNRCPRWQWPSEPVVKGDSRVAAISAASILAKVTRDREMQAMDALYPGYGLAGHKGYPTPAHVDALNTLGVTPIHRRSFRPVSEALASVGIARVEEGAFPEDLFEL
ncbi:MAG: ribonuclease HII [Alteromonadaceae bacterium]|nr:ribonuclease HII [Alteromonadaceae bacterium]MBH85896.1 ribonuclease HII [Alteromonadaceae bacterium]MBH87516.1 ribonuclease HII [Alteromonadaceae bacterium]|tara:strand:- start:75196 stop:75861 length:666 start_codon:yes stop_codon:yes gene_type:complete